MAEVLVALLVSAVGLTLPASMINTSSHLVQSSRSDLKEYYSQNSQLITAPSASSGAVTLTYNNSFVDVPVKLSTGSSITVYYYVSGADDRVVLYKE